MSKAYGLISRFSSDVDFAILTDGLSQNQLKKLVARIGHDSTIGLEENNVVGSTIKNNRYRKTYHSYRSVLVNPDPSFSFLGSHVIVEINTYANPYPYCRREIKSFMTEMMQRRGLYDVIKKYDMMPYTLNVLDKRQTLCEKAVSLLRYSFSDNPKDGIASKVRHFYDIHFLLNDRECVDYLSKGFISDLTSLISHDKMEFDRPPKWRDSPISSSILLTDFYSVWDEISTIFKAELGALSYRELPASDDVAASTKKLFDIIAEIYT